MANFNPAPGRYVTRPGQLPAGSHALFAAGHGYYTAPAPALQVKPPPPGGKKTYDIGGGLRKPAPRPKSQTVSQAANQQVNQQLAPVLASQDAQNATQNQAIQQFALALLGKLQPIAGQVGQQYDAAIGQTAALAGASADALRNANPNQQDQTMLAAINAPAEQRAQVQNQLANTFGGGAAAQLFTQGEVPGTQLATDKAAAQSQASQLPGIAALKGQQDLAGALTQQNQARQTTLAQRPGLVQQATQNIRSNLNAKSAAAFDQYKFQTARADAYQAAGMKQQAEDARTKAGLAYKYYSTNAENQRAASSQANQNARTQAQIDAANKRSQATIAAQNKRATVAAAKAAKVKTGTAAAYPNLTKAQVLHLRAGVAHAWSGVPEQRDANNKVTQKALPPVGYEEAINEAVQAGYSRAAATRMANRFYQPGQRGRPSGNKSVNPTKNPAAAGPPAP